MSSVKKSFLVMGGVAIILMATQVTEAVETKGTINFVPENNPTGEIHTPDPETNEPEVIILDSEEGTTTKEGPLRIQFVPNFKFGTYTGITANANQQNAELLIYSQADQKKPIAPFVQVGDYRGLEGKAGAWRLDVKASPFQNVEKNQVLNNIEIRLHGSTLTMDYKDSHTAQQLVTGQDLGATINADGQSVTRIMSTKENRDISGYNVSNVFHNNYDKNMDYGTVGGQPVNTTAGVEFYKPKGESPIKGIEYTSVLTWTLTSGR